MIDNKVVDTTQDKLRRIAWHLQDEGNHVKANYCLDIIYYITELEEFRRKAYEVHPNIDIDIERLK